MSLGCTKSIKLCIKGLRVLYERLFVVAVFAPRIKFSRMFKFIPSNNSVKLYSFKIYLSKNLKDSKSLNIIILYEILKRNIKAYIGKH